MNRTHQRGCRFLAALVGAAAGASSAHAQQAHDWTVSGSLRVRTESWDWFQPPNSDFDSRYTFTGALLRVSGAHPVAQGEFRLELAAPLLLGLPRHAMAPAPQGALGLGATYRATNGSQTGSAFVKQLFATRTLRPGAIVRAGRFEFAEGAETVPGDPALAWVKRERVAQRLIGPFAWTHVGRSFDGVHYSATTPQGNLTTLVAVPTRGVFDLDGMNSLGNVALAYLGATRTHYEKKRATPGEERLFALWYEDRRQGVTRVDNNTTRDKAGIRLATVGGHVMRAGTTRGGSWDALGWAAAQTGKWGRQNARGLACAVEAGYHPRGSAATPWLRTGYFVASGDGNPDDNTHATFYPLLNTPRIYARTPLYTEANIRDLFVQAIWKPQPKWNLRADWHQLGLDRSRDLWYLAGGPFQSSPSFGLVGRKGNGARALAQLVDLSAETTLDKNTSATLYVSKILGKSVIQGIYGDRNGSLAYLELLRRW